MFSWGSTITYSLSNAIVMTIIPTLNCIKDFFQQLAPTPIRYLTTINHKHLYIKQDYLNHATIQGNKLRKLKYTLLAAANQQQTLISFGGAYSNHIAALAAAGYAFNLPTVGIIRGAELAAKKNHWSKTLTTAYQQGMQLHFVSRAAYRNKQQSPEIQSIIQQYPTHQLIAEGGSNRQSVYGSMEIITEIAATPTKFTTLFAASGTGGTLAGLIDGVVEQQLCCQIIGVPVLKGNKDLMQNICQLSQAHQQVNWQLNPHYHFGGYAKTTTELTAFQQRFEQQFQIPLDPIYTAKLCYAVFDLAANATDNQAENWLIYHSGGLQGRG